MIPYVLATYQTLNDGVCGYTLSDLKNIQDQLTGDDTTTEGDAEAPVEDGSELANDGTLRLRQSDTAEADSEITEEPV